MPLIKVDEKKAVPSQLTPLSAILFYIQMYIAIYWGLKRRGHKLMIWTVYHRVGVCYYKQGGIWWTGWGWGGTDMGLGKGMSALKKRSDIGAMAVPFMPISVLHEHSLS